MLAAMDPHPHPQDPNPDPDSNTAEKKGRFGCSGCLVVILGILLITYVLIFQTSIPLKLIAGNIEKNTVIDGRRMEINGVGGSFSRGVRIKKLIIPGEYGDTTITNLKFKYKRPVRWFTRGQVTITEISTNSAEFVVANDFFDSDEEDEAPEEWEEEHDSHHEENAASGGGFFQLHLLKFQDTRIRSADGSVNIHIPLIHMEGLHIDHDDFKIEKFEIDSNMLSASLADGRTVEIDGETVSFDQRIDILVKPAIHESVIKEIPLSFDFGKDKGRTTSRITALDGAMEQVDFNGERSLVRFNSLSPLEYLKFDDYLIPNHLNLRVDQEGERIKLDAGNFSIGQTAFNFESREFNESEDEAIIGTGNAGPYDITATINPVKSDKAWPPIEVELSSKPEAPKNEILAQLYHGKTYGELSKDEKAVIDSLQ